MNSSRANLLLARWQDLRDRIFGLDIKIAVLTNLRKLSEEDYYLDLRGTSEARVLHLIEQLSSLSPGQWSDFIKVQPLTLLGFLYDRVLYVEQYLGELGDAEVLDVVPDGMLLKWGLVKLWDERDIVKYP